jgi:tetratricopeptide (TPR) repeat protein
LKTTQPTNKPTRDHAKGAKTSIKKPNSLGMARRSDDNATAKPIQPSEPQDPLDRQKRWLISLGPVGIFALILVYVYWNWDRAGTLLAVEPTLEWVGKSRIRQASIDKFKIAVARLQNDPNRENETLLLAELEKFNGVAIVRIDRTIVLASGKTQEEALASGHAEGRALLSSSDSQVLLWGSVLQHDQRSVLQLRWTIGSSDPGRKWTARYHPEDDLSLPPVFWGDATKILGLLVQSRVDSLQADEGTDHGDRLRPFIMGVRRLSDGQNVDWQPDERASIEFALAYALGVLGDEAGDTSALQEAIARNRSIGNLWSRELAPIKWAVTQNSIGNALMILGEREPGRAHLEEAVGTYLAALEVATRERTPILWGLTEINLGTALVRLGQRGPEMQPLNRAVDAYRSALKVITRKNTPLQWAMAQNDLGNALAMLGDRDSGTQSLMEAVDAYRSALEVVERKRVPLFWAMIQNDLGISLEILGERESGTQHLNEAMAAYSAALEERTRERVPLKWAATKCNLCFTLGMIGRRDSGTRQLKASVGACRDALQETTRERVPLQWAITQNDLGISLEILGEREAGTEDLEEAISSYQAALDVFRAAGATYYTDKAASNLSRSQLALVNKNRVAH